MFSKRGALVTGIILVASVGCVLLAVLKGHSATTPEATVSGRANRSTALRQSTTRVLSDAATEDVGVVQSARNDLQPGTALLVTVSHEDGQPAVGARVSLAAARSEESFSYPECTDSDGVVAISDSFLEFCEVPKILVRVAASLPGGEPVEALVDLSSKQSSNCSIILSRPGALRVVIPIALAIPGLILSVEDSGIQPKQLELSESVLQVRDRDTQYVEVGGLGTERVVSCSLVGYDNREVAYSDDEIRASSDRIIEVALSPAEGLLLFEFDLPDNVLPRGDIAVSAWRGARCLDWTVGELSVGRPQCFRLDGHIDSNWWVMAIPTSEGLFGAKVNASAHDTDLTREAVNVPLKPAEFGLSGVLLSSSNEYLDIRPTIQLFVGNDMSEDTRLQTEFMVVEFTSEGGRFTLQAVVPEESVSIAAVERDWELVEQAQTVGQEEEIRLVFRPKNRTSISLAIPEYNPPNLWPRGLAVWTVDSEGRRTAPSRIRVGNDGQARISWDEPLGLEVSLHASWPGGSVAHQVTAGLPIDTAVRLDNPLVTTRTVSFGSEWTREAVPTWAAWRETVSGDWFMERCGHDRLTILAEVGAEVWVLQEGRGLTRCDGLHSHHPEPGIPVTMIGGRATESVRILPRDDTVIYLWSNSRLDRATTWPGLGWRRMEQGRMTMNVPKQGAYVIEHRQADGSVNQRSVDVTQAVHVEL